MRNTIYFRIFETETHAEYHVSANKQDVVDGKAMSRQVKKPAHPFGVNHYKDKWRKEAALYNATDVDL